MTSNEQTPLLAAENIKPKRTPLPWFQFSIVLFLQLAEPLTSQVIYPFAPQLIRDIGVTNGDETKVGYYVGLMQSLFFMTQAMTVLHWSRLSDRIGRKPVILTGLCGLSASMYCFGLSKTFWGLVLSRCLNGALNGNIGVIKSMMAEMTDATNISQVYAYMPIAWSTGGTLGPIIGGSLSHPVEQFPYFFGDISFLMKYPYFLPCAVPATFSLIAWFVTFTFLKETVSSPVLVKSLFSRDSKAVRQKGAVGLGTPPTAVGDAEMPLPLRKLLTPRVIVSASNYAFLSLVDIAFRAVQPLFLSTPIGLGGLGLSPAIIGRLLSIFGILNGIFQIFYFADIHDRWGSKRVFIAGIVAVFPLFALFPIISALAQRQGLSLIVWVLLGLQILISIMPGLSYGAIFIFITASAPNKRSLGAVNGLSQMTVSVMRAIGPAAANSLFSLSIAQHYMGGWLIYYVLMAVVGVATFVACLLPNQLWVNHES